MELDHKNELELKNPLLIHDQLNPMLWDTDTNLLLPDVREALLNIYNDFLKSNFTDNSVTIPVVDLHLLGSQAGYNYTEHSDIDLHLLVNFELLYEKDDVLQLLYQTVTRKFNSDLDITVKDIPVELYIQDLKSVNRSTGVYSVFEDRWVQEPGQPPEISQETLETANEIADELITATQAVLDNKDTATLAQVEQLINDIYVVRKQSLTEFDEFSAGNLAFKILRSTGLLDEVKQLHKDLRGKELSLAEQNKSQELKEDHCIDCGEQVDHDEDTCPYCGSIDIHRTEDDLRPSPKTDADDETDNIKHPYQFITDLEGYVYHDKNRKTVFNLTKKQAKDKAHYMNKEAEKKSGSNPGYKPYLAEGNNLMEQRNGSEKQTRWRTLLANGLSPYENSEYQVNSDKSISYQGYYIDYVEDLSRWAVNDGSYILALFDTVEEAKADCDEQIRKVLRELREDKDQDDILSLLDNLQKKAIMKCTIKRLTEGTNQKRVSHYKEFDNGHVLHNWKNMSDEEAQEIARLQSIDNPNDIFYVAYDDVMNPDSDTRWVNGKSYNYDEVELQGGKPKFKENKDQDDILNLLDKLQEKAENIDFDYYRSELNLTEVIELINKLRSNYRGKELKEDVNSQETYEGTSAAANLTALVNSEIEAINLYTSVIEACSCEKTKAVLEEILQDEKDHINLLSTLIDDLVTEAFPTNETVEEIIDEAGMNPVPVEDTTAVVTMTESPDTIPTVALLSEDITDKTNVDECIQDYRENAFGYGSIKDYVETQYPKHDQKLKDNLVKLMTKKLTEDVDDSTEEGDVEQVAEDLMDEIKAKGFEVTDDSTFSVTSSESGYTATVSVADSNHFTVVLTESNGDVLESLVITGKEELFDYLSLLTIESEEYEEEN